MIITTDKQLRPRDPDDFYPTPDWCCSGALALLPADLSPCWIVDPGAGAGPWGAAARRRWPLATIAGYELRETVRPASYNDWIIGDFLQQPAPEQAPDLIIGNPPYKHAEAFVRRSLDLLWPGGYLVFLLRLAFLEGQARGAGLWREHRPQIVGVCSQRPSFTGDGNTDATAYACFVWCKGWHGETRLTWIANETPAEAPRKRRRRS